MRVWQGWLLAAIIVIAATATDHHFRHKAKIKWAQAGYDYGKSIGTTLGRCDALISVAKANADSQWAADFRATTKPSCDALIAADAARDTVTLNRR